jgi:acyl carrier protein
MDSKTQQLVSCFTTVFPGLGEDQAQHATMDNVRDWDSSHHFMLMQVVEEAFSIRIPEAAMGEIVSFRGFEDYLASGAPEA